MKNSQEIVERIRFILTGAEQKVLLSAGARLPHLCKYNHRHSLDSRKEVAGRPNPDYNTIQGGVANATTLGLCMFGSEDPETWSGDICEDPIDAVKCPFFTSRVSEDGLRSEFQANIDNPAWVSDNLPEVHGLLWVLDKTGVPPAPTASPKPWWGRLFYWLRCKLFSERKHVRALGSGSLPSHRQNSPEIR